MKGRTDDLPVRACGACDAPFQPVKSQQRYCKPNHRPSARSIAVRMSPEAALALEAAHFTLQRKRKRMTPEKFDEMFEGARERQEDIYLNTGRVVPLESLAE